VPPVTVPVPIATSYFQYDQQGVVFNMWYFGWFDDAMTQFLGEVGYPYTALNADGLDVQLVHTEADWRDAVRYGEQVEIDVATERIGSTSFTLSFACASATRCARPAAPSTWWSAPMARASGRYRPSSGLDLNRR
jgi:Predicted thioesterase